MQYRLLKVGAEWQIEVSHTPDLEPHIEVFKDRKAADKWLKEVREDKSLVPVLEPLKADIPADTKLRKARTSKAGGADKTVAKRGKKK